MAQNKGNEGWHRRYISWNQIPQIVKKQNHIKREASGKKNKKKKLRQTTTRFVDKRQAKATFKNLLLFSQFLAKRIVGFSYLSFIHSYFSLTFLLYTLIFARAIKDIIQILVEKPWNLYVIKTL